jgi:hypothetical protein
MSKKALGFMTALLIISASGFAAFRYGFDRADHSKAKDVAAPTNERKVDGRRQLESAVNKAIEAKPVGLRDSIRQYRTLVRDIDQLLSEGLEQRNDGGVLGFERITDKEALVTRVLSGQVRLDHVEVMPVSSGSFRVRINVTNLTTFPMACAIQKGQIFELKDPTPDKQISTRRKTTIYPQNVTKSEGDSNDGIYVIPPRDEGTIEFTSFCINEGLRTPRGPANITIYQLKDRSFKSLASLHASMRKLYSTKKVSAENGATRS